MLLRHEKRAQSRGFRLIAGIDEAGRGPLAGPVVASAVIIKDPRFTNRIDDSKRLTPRQRNLAYQEIFKKSIVSIGIIGHKAIDRVNIRQATILAMQKAVSNLKITPDLLLIDGRITLNLPYSQRSIVKGDTKSLSIAAASIIAKVTRDQIMLKYHNTYPKYRFDLHKGYGTTLHIKSLKKHGLCPIHRKSFKSPAYRKS